MANQDKNGPLDGSATGTIGGGGPETGGSTPRPAPPDAPPATPEDAQRTRAPDAIGATAEPDPPALTILEKKSEDVSRSGD